MAEPRTILDVMTGPFASFFPMPTWRPWLLVAAAAFGLAHGLDADDQAFVLRCLGRTELPREPATGLRLVIGRRGGKSRFASFLAVFLACFRDYRGVLAPGERGTVMIICPDRRQARVCFNYVRAFLDGVPALAALARLAAVLEMARTDPAGEAYEPHQYVFGEVGEQTDNTKRSWETCVLKAHGHRPVWRKTGLAPASRAALKAIILHFHDLRHEGASRRLEEGWPLTHVQEMLGHASLEQTSTYLNVQKGGLRKSMRKSDEARSLCNPVAILPAIEHPLLCNEENEKGDKPTVN